LRSSISLKCKSVFGLGGISQGMTRPPLRLGALKKQSKRGLIKLGGALQEVGGERKAVLLMQPKTYPFQTKILGGA